MKLGVDLKKITIFFVFAIMSPLAHSGGMEGGGGKSVVCRDAQGKITKAELLDLFEGRTQYQLKYSESSVPWKIQSRNILLNSGAPTDTSFPPREIIDWLENVSEKINIVSNEVVLKSTNDSYEVIAPAGCNIEQVANYKNDQTILVAEEIWNAFSETQKSALVIHEATYRYLRDHKETNSIRARHFTAHIISGKKVVSPQHIYPNESAYCYGGDTSISITSFFDNNGKAKNRIYFKSLAGRQMLSETFVDVDSVDQHGFVFLDLLESVPTGMVYSIALKTLSLFEPGDLIGLSISQDRDGQTEVVLKGTSAVDESRFSVNISCLLTRP